MAHIEVALSDIVRLAVPEPPLDEQGADAGEANGEAAAPSPSDVAEPRSPAARHAMRTERIALSQRLVLGGDAVAVAVPVPLHAASGEVLTVILRLVAPSDLEASARAVVDEEWARVTSRAGTSPSSTPTLVDEQLLAALQGLASPDGAREALLFIAERTDAPIAVEFVLVSDDAAVDELAQETLGRLRRRGIADRDAAGWELESAVLERWLADLRSGSLAPSHAAILVERLGEAGRHASFLEESLRAVTSTRALASRALEENRILLRDSSPAARVRASGWLRARGEDLGDYDPLASYKERRAAIAKIEEAAEAKAAAAATDRTTAHRADSPASNGSPTSATDSEHPTRAAGGIDGP